MVMPGTVSGSPASSRPMRATFMPCSASGIAHPVTTSPISRASRFRHLARPPRAQHRGQHVVGAHGAEGTVALGDRRALPRRCRRPGSVCSLSVPPGSVAQGLPVSSMCAMRCWVFSVFSSSTNCARSTSRIHCSLDRRLVSTSPPHSAVAAALGDAVIVRRDETALAMLTSIISQVAMPLRPATVTAGRPAPAARLARPARGARIAAAEFVGVERTSSVCAAEAERDRLLRRSSPRWPWRWSGRRSGCKEDVALAARCASACACRANSLLPPPPGSGRRPPRPGRRSSRAPHAMRRAYEPQPPPSAMPCTAATTGTCACFDRHRPALELATIAFQRLEMPGARRPRPPAPVGADRERRAGCQITSRRAPSRRARRRLRRPSMTTPRPPRASST